VAHPLRGIIPTLDAPVIETLAATTRPLTGREVNRIAGVGSARGVQLVLRRLASQGLVLVEERGNAGFYLANREHLAWPALESLARLRLALRARLSEEIGAWPIQPLHASVFGSAARGDGDSASDIDLLMIRPDEIESVELWDDQLDRLRDGVPRWTGTTVRHSTSDAGGLPNTSHQTTPWSMPGSRTASTLRDRTCATS